MAEQHQQMQQQHQAQHITAQILNVQGGVATLDDSVPVQIMMPAGVVMEQHHQVQQEQQIQVPQHVQEMQEVIQEAVGSATTQVVQEDPKLTNKKELSKQWKSLCKRAKQWCSMHDDSVPNFVMMYLDENRLVWEGPDHMESFISDESVISAFLRTAALSESLIGMEKRGVDEMQDVAPRPAKKQKKAETPSTSKKGMTDDEVIASILEKPEAVPESAAGDEGAGADGDDSDGDNVPSQTTDTDQPSQSTSEGPTQSGEGDVLSQVIESVIKDWAPGQGPPPTSQEGEEETGDASAGMVSQNKSETKQWKCPACKIEIDKKRLVLHLKEKHGNLVCFCCKSCHKELPDEPALKRHLAECQAHKSHIASKHGLVLQHGKFTCFLCKSCHKEFPGEVALKRHLIECQAHIASKHESHIIGDENEQPMDTDADGESDEADESFCEFDGETGMLINKKGKLFTPETPLTLFECGICSKRFGVKANLLAHQSMLHKRPSLIEGETPLSVKQVTKNPIWSRRSRMPVLPSDENRMTEIVVSTSDKDVMMRNSEPDASFEGVFKKALAGKDGHYKCPHCLLDFRTDYQTMYKHVRAVHREETTAPMGAPKIFCPQCDAYFYHAETLEAHIVSEHMKKPLTCECGEQFKVYYELSRHRKKRCKTWAKINASLVSDEAKPTSSNDTPAKSIFVTRASAGSGSELDNVGEKPVSTFNAGSPKAQGKVTPAKVASPQKSKPVLKMASPAKSKPVLATLKNVTANTLPPVPQHLPSDFLETKLSTDAIAESSASPQKTDAMVESSASPKKTVFIRFPGNTDRTLKVTVPTNPNHEANSIVTDGDKSYLLSYKNGAFTAERITSIVDALV